VAAFLWPLPARAGHSHDFGPDFGQVTPCLTVEVMVPQLLAMNEDAEEIARFLGGQAQEFMDFYNAIPPATQHEGDEVVVFYRPSRLGVLFYVFQRGCYVGRSFVSVERFRRAYPDIPLPSPETPA